jgi:acetoin utilization deacetylase AcuC-like enzyme
MKIFYADHYVLPLPPGHRFPMAKYSELRRRVTEAPWLERNMLHVPYAASEDEIVRAHSADYLRRVMAGELSAKEIRRVGFPWTPQMVERSRRSAGATLEACRTALQHGCGVNLAGGTHHAFHDHGEGYCVFNDAAIAARAMLGEGRAARIAIVDCDVHQGNGTAAITLGDESIFTFSIHAAKNFPFKKERSDLDVELADDTGDQEYLARLAAALAETLARAQPDLIIYLAGADPFERDRLGRLKLTKDGLRARDALVLDACRKRDIPVAIAMAGGYGYDIADTVDIHFQTVELAVHRYA